MDKRTFTFPTSQIKLNGKKSSYYEVIHSHMFEDCDKAAGTIFGRLDFNKVYELIDATDLISNIRKRFYKEIITYRYERIFIE